MNRGIFGFPGFIDRAATGLTRLLKTRFIRDTVNANTPVMTVEVDADEVSNSDIALVPKGTGAILGATPDAAVTGGNKRGIYAIDLQLARTATTQVAAGTYAVLSGGANNTSSGGYSVISGGTNNISSSAYSVISGGIGNNTSDCNYSSIGGGNANTFSGGNSYGTIAGGNTNSINSWVNSTWAPNYSSIAGGSGNVIWVGPYSTISGGNGNVIGRNSSSSGGHYSVICGGDRNTIVDGQYSVIGGGLFNTIPSAQYNAIPGGAYGTTRGLIGYLIWPGAAPIASVVGNSQSGKLILGRQTTDGTATILASSQAAASSANTLTLPNASAYYFKGSVIAFSNASSLAKSWKIEGTIRRGASAATTTLVGTPVVTSVAANTGTEGWSFTLTADTTNGSLAVTVTGAAATTIRWVCVLDTTEVTF